MSSFQDYLASSNNRVNESVPSSADIRRSKSATDKIGKELKSKLKHLDVDVNGGDITVGNDRMNDDPKLSARLGSYDKELYISQSSHSDHTVKSLTKLSNMAKELADNYNFIFTKLKEARDIEKEILG